MLNKTRRLSLLFAVCTGLPSACAIATGTPASTTITLKVTIEEPTCTISAPSTVDMGTHYPSEWSGKGSYPPDNEKKLSVTVSDCGASGMKAKLRFSGTPDADDSQAFANATGEGHATGVGLYIYAIQGHTHHVGPNGDTWDAYDLPEPGATKDIDLFADLEGTKDVVTPGDINVSTTVSLDYE